MNSFLYYKFFKKSHCRISGKIGMFEMPEINSIEIDSSFDLLQAKKIMDYKEKL